MERECPGCGQRVPVGKQKSGTWVVCPACGRFFKLTAPILPLNALRPRAMRSWAARLAIGAAVLLFCTAIVVAVVMTTRAQPTSPAPQPPSPDPRLAQLLRLKTDADDLEASGRFAEAIARYQQLRAAVSDSHDPAIAQLLQNARRSQSVASSELESMIDRPPPASAPAKIESADSDFPDTPPPAPQTLPATRAVVTAPPSIPVPATQPSPAYARAAIRPDPQPVDDLDRQIGHAIERGVGFLLREMDVHRRSLVPVVDPQGHAGGADALVLYALLQAGQSIDDPRLKPSDRAMDGAIAKLKGTQFGRWQVYGRSLRCAALAVYDRKQDHEVLKADAEWLIHATGSGAYTYDRGFAGPPPNPSVPHDPSRPTAGDTMGWDNSNSQYALLGVWSAAERGIEVPSRYWQEVEAHWTYYQLPDGQWYYGRGNDREPRTSMTCAGIASLFVAHDYLDGPRYANDVGREPFSPALKAGLDWLEAGDHSTDLHVLVAESESRDWAYNVFGLERVGLASGFKYFGRHDWYRELAREVMSAQADNGSWRRGSIIDTAYMVLFLSRGRHPILMNKLRFNGYWANRPRGEANLARFASHELERPLNWQVVPIDRDWMDWADSPILSLSSHHGTMLDDADLEKLRTFAMAGGLLFLNADGDSPEFDAFAKALCAKLFPQYELTDVPANHPVFSVVYPITLRPPLKMISNGSRALVIYSPTDIERRWQARDELVGRRFFELGVNLFVYAAGKRDLHNRLDSTYVMPPSAAPVQTISVARLKYAGAWDPEPLAWPRFARVFGRRTGYAIQGRAVSISELAVGTAPVAHLTGSFAYTFTDAEVEALRRYVQSGGVLLMDSCGGGGAFAQSQDDLISRAFPGATPKLVQPADPLLSPSSDGMQDLGKLKLRPYAVDILGPHAGAFHSIRWGAGHVIFTPFDLTSGLLGTQTWGILGYDPAWSQDFMQNLILWTLDGQKADRL